MMGRQKKLIYNALADEYRKKWKRKQKEKLRLELELKLDVIWG